MSKLTPFRHIPQAFNGKPQTAGGLATYAKYGSEHMSRIGKRGYESMVERYFAGNKEAANDWLARKGRYIIDRDVNYGPVFEDPGPHPAHRGGQL